MIELESMFHFWMYIEWLWEKKKVYELSFALHDDFLCVKTLCLFELQASIISPGTLAFLDAKSD